MGVGSKVVDSVDLRPLLADRDAAQMLQLARGQLNAAFRKHGMFPPDPLPVGEVASLDIEELDDPAAKGRDYALTHFHDAFEVWSAAMPQKLVAPVLAILKQAEQALQARVPVDADAAAAVERAQAFLQECDRPAEGYQN